MWKRAVVGAALGAALIGPAAARRLEVPGRLPQLSLAGEAAIAQPVVIRRGDRVSTSLAVPLPVFSRPGPSPRYRPSSAQAPHMATPPVQAIDDAGAARASADPAPAKRASPPPPPALRPPAAPPRQETGAAASGWRLVWPILVAASMVLMIWVGLGGNKSALPMKVMGRIGVANALLPLAIFVVGAPRGLGEEFGTSLLLEGAVLLGIPIALGWAFSGLLPPRPS